MEMWSSRAAYRELFAATVSTLWMHSIFGKGYAGAFQVEGKTTAPVP